MIPSGLYLMEIILKRFETISDCLTECFLRKIGIRRQSLNESRFFPQISPISTTRNAPYVSSPSTSERTVGKFARDARLNECLLSSLKSTQVLVPRECVIREGLVGAQHRSTSHRASGHAFESWARMANNYFCFGKFESMERQQYRQSA